jgi:hypothetical protein
MAADITKLGIDSDFDSEYIAFVRKLEEKTRAKKILWAKTPQGYAAETSSMIFSFTRRPMSLNPMMSIPRFWGLFTVRKRNGQELIKVEPSSGISVENVLHGGGSLTRSVDSLFAEVKQSAKSDVDKALNELDQL